MDLNKYISSGVLELYAAGALSKSEARDVEAMAHKYPEVKAELDAIQRALTGYAGAYRKNPNPELRHAVLEKIEETEGTSHNVVVLPRTVKQPQPVQKSRWRYLIAAVWVFLVLNIAGNIYFYTKLQNTEKQMADVLSQNYVMKAEYERIRSEMEKKSADLKMVMNRQNKIIDMKGMEIAPGAFATVYWNPATKQVMLNVENLPMPPKDMQYQLWALKDGKPVDAGVFDMTGDMHMMPVKISEADAFAVTLEKSGGSPAPTLERLYVMGKI